MENCKDLQIEPFDGSLMNVSLEGKVGTSLECTVCGKNYRTKNTLHRHLKVHDDRYQAHCSHCTLFFESQKDLEKHKYKFHSQKRLCSECGKQFVNKNSLRIHLKLMHTATSRYELVCTLDSCGKKFTKKSKYQDHVNKHSGLKLHGCSTCGKMFFDRYYKTEHEKVCSGERTIACLDCNAVFADRSVLKKHRDAQHQKKLNVCQHCGKMYKYSNSLSRHRKVENH